MTTRQKPVDWCQTGGKGVGGRGQQEGFCMLQVADAPRLMPQSHSSNVQLLDLINAADCEGGFLSNGQAVWKAP